MRDDDICSASDESEQDQINGRRAQREEGRRAFVVFIGRLVKGKERDDGELYQTGGVELDEGPFWYRRGGARGTAHCCFGTLSA